MANDYEVLNTRSTMYQNKAGKVIRGYSVEYVLLDFDEYHELQVPSLDLDTIKEAIESVLEQRKKLAEL